MSDAVDRADWADREQSRLTVEREPAEDVDYGPQQETPWSYKRHRYHVCNGTPGHPTRPCTL